VLPLLSQFYLISRKHSLVKPCNSHSPHTVFVPFPPMEAD